MKKISVLAIAFVACLSLNAQAQEGVTTQQQQTTTQQEKQRISSEDLPDAVKSVVAEGAYKDWMLGEVYKVEATEEGTLAVYELQFLNGEEESVVVRYDENGKQVDS
ncbi:hypothetical protein [Pontibacter oryzae]|uniref:PepSY domain-containing protein n=1 Tax=Pontibacter oryzae TaxID=2304593 RepID=A0A399S525_9BACT|nr:hypothetical protein [Pontibacter oryzae]RIJ37503.1 hypothetical protein D1627_10320 [Pontibacter oryzae]